ncbi:hypothetical protein JXM67_15200 [candidate division WOR-3 bacterium]|nr:hypothetical protein [candidate division WOR-3 bacterium]
MVFEELMEKPNGSKPMWADLAIKTPASPDYEVGGDFEFAYDESRMRIIDKIVTEALEREIRILATADYNLGLSERGAWIDELVAVAGDRGVSVYPGLRLILEEGVDLIVLFEPERPQAELEKFLDELGLEKEGRFYRNNRPVPVTLPPREVIARARSNKGMILSLYNDALREHPGVLTDPWLWGVLLTQPLTDEDEQILSGNHKGFERRLPLARLAGSFAKSPEEIGKEKVSVKLGTPNLEGMRLALLDAGTKVLFPHQIEKRSYSQLLGARWEGGFLDGLEIHFNPGFNSLIGGRGTGKTTIIETIRYALDELPKTDRNRESHEQILRDVFMPGSKISLLVESHDPLPKRYLIERIYPFTPVVRNAENGEKLDVNPKDVFRGEVFGNKEIYEISKQQNFQLRLLERLCEKEIYSLKEQEELILEKLKHQTEEITTLTDDLAKRDGELGKLAAAEEKLNRFLEMDMPAKIEEKRGFEQEGHVFSRGETVLVEMKKMLLDLISETSSRLRSVQEGTAKPLHPDLIDEYTNTLVEFVGDFEGSIQALINTLQITEERHNQYKEQWDELYAEGEERFRESLRSLQDRFPGMDINEYINLEKEVLRLREFRVARDAVATKLSMKRDERLALLGELRELRASRLEVLSNRVKTWNTELDGKIRIEISRKGAPRRIVTELRHFIPTLDTEDALRIAEDEGFSFAELARLSRSGDSEALAGLLKLSPQSSVPTFEEETLCRMEMVYSPPEVIIQLNLGTKKETRYRDVEHLSDGQRCTAILGILLLESPYPLVVDQPEEDLDNAFIVEEIAKRFREEMDKRQFLVATHNANIPVLGDASQILALEADVEHGYLREGRYGYIDSPEIKDLVERILEGGREAFEIRKEKYGL